MRLLLAEDDEGIVEPLVRSLRREGYEIDRVADGHEAVRQALAGEHDLLVLDIGLPGVDGLEVCRRVRAVRPRAPILMLTAQSDELDVVAGLDAGANDYVAKPFRLSELLARIRALLRRGVPDAVAAQTVRMDVGARRAWRGDAELELIPKEFDLLALLVAEAGRVVRREAHHGRGLGRELVRLDQDAGHARLLGVGFRFEA